MGERKPGTPATFRRRWLWLAGGLAALGGLVLAWIWLRPAASVPATDPRLTANTPYRNVRPEVRYVGDAACAECHKAEAETYRLHPMGRSLAPVADLVTARRYDETVHNPFEADGFRYRVEPRGDRVFHQETCPAAQGETLAENRVEIDFAIGSGTRGQSFLFSRDGFLFQSPITWYAQEGAWDLAPGYKGRRASFERGIRPECLFCHCNHADHVEHTVNQYRTPVFQGHAIGCERCHGPGELHVASRRGGAADGPDYTIVNPADLTPPLRESVCQQCHLQGAARVVRRGLDTFAYRPGLPLHLFWSVYVRPPEFADHVLVGQVEQMYASRCFRESGVAGRGTPKMGCVSCHDPHAVPAPDQKVAHYRGGCLQCHGEGSCGLAPEKRRETSKEDSCIVCHMPRLPTTDIGHTAVTDHRIVRTPHAPAQPPPPRRLKPGEVPLTHFHHDLIDPDDPELARDLGLALVDLARDPSPASRQLGETAEGLLDAAVKRAPDDDVAWEGRGRALWAQDRRPEALASSERALALVPTREQSLIDAATWAEALGKRAEAIAYWERARAVNPWALAPRFRLARLWSEEKEWDKAVVECREVLRINPANIEARLVLVAHHLEQGDKGRARAEFDAVLGLHPTNPDALRRWYAEKAR
jgi:predicted CXXCH cytochrome family protein